MALSAALRGKAPAASASIADSARTPGELAGSVAAAPSVLSGRKWRSI